MRIQGRENSYITQYPKGIFSLCWNLIRDKALTKEEYDFSNARKNPYADKVKQQITINLNQSTVQYFKDLAEKTGLPYQTLINLYLTDCADKKRQPEVNWIPA
jgi:predicted DNA binding CopG/RHH family protein